MKKINISLKKGFFSVFSFHFPVLYENEGKSKKYINFLWQFIFISQNCINYPVSSVSWRINILSMKDQKLLIQIAYVILVKGGFM